EIWSVHLDLTAVDERVEVSASGALQADSGSAEDISADFYASVLEHLLLAHRAHKWPPQHRDHYTCWASRHAGSLLAASWLGWMIIALSVQFQRASTAVQPTFGNRLAASSRELSACLFTYLAWQDIM